MDNLPNEVHHIIINYLDSYRLVYQFVNYHIKLLIDSYYKYKWQNNCPCNNEYH